MSESATVSATVGSEATASAAPTVESITADVGNTGEATPSTNEWYLRQRVFQGLVTNLSASYMMELLASVLGSSQRLHPDLQSHYGKDDEGFRWCT